jgi:predicted lipid-binding transport protein (Tim44 family)
MQNGFDPLTIIFIGLAIFIAWRLRSVLGQKTGHEKPPEPIFKPRDSDTARTVDGNDNVVPLPSSAKARPQERVAREQEGPRWGTLVQADSEQAKGFDAIAAIEPDFDAQDFSEGAKYAYEMIVTAFAKGDRKTLKDLLTKEVFDSFNDVIEQRERDKHTVESTFVGIDKLTFDQVSVKGKDAAITVTIHSQLISATRDAAGNVIEGNPETITTVSDTWTFARQLKSDDPNWLLAATGGDD